MMPLLSRSPRTIAARRAPFTLIELLVVMAVIAILAGMVIGGVGIANRKAAEAKTRALLTQFEIAFDQYKQQYGYYPQWSATTTDAVWAPINQRFVRGNATDMGLEDASPAPRGKYLLDVTTLTFTGTDTAHEKFQRTATASDGYIEYDGPTNPLMDSFGNAIYYRCPGFQNKESYDLWSAGADGKYGAASTTPRTGSSGATDATDAINSDDLNNWKKN
ncbi:MAG: type II secretion system protein GspG [Lentisphaeria bacterium]